MHTVICLSSLFFCSWYVTSATADLYQWTDVNGVLHIVDEAVGVPDQYRDELTVYHVAEAQDPPEPAPLPLSPSRTYATYSQGAFAQKLALDLGLIKSDKEDALGPLGGVGIRPAGSWKVSDPLSPEALGEIVAAVQRAAQSQRIALSADEATAAVENVAQVYLPPPPAEPAPSVQPEVLVIQQPSQIIEVVHEPHYVPVPFVVDGGRFPNRPRMRNQFRGGGLEGGVVAPPSGASRLRQEPGKPPVPSLTKAPFGASRLPMGFSRLPLGASSAASRTLGR